MQGVSTIKELGKDTAERAQFTQTTDEFEFSVRPTLACPPSLFVFSFGFSFNPFVVIRFCFFNAYR